MEHGGIFTLDDQGPITYLRVESELPIQCGFTTRFGGVSTTPYASANMGFHVGDDPQLVRRNRQLLAAMLAGGRRSLPLVTVSQVHGNRCQVVEDVAPGALQQLADQQADALLTSRSGVLLGVLTADCLPVIVVDRQCRGIAVVHAGWRGILARVVPRTLAAMAARFAVQLEDVLVFFGPCIGSCCYQVGPELVERFVRELPFAADLSWRTKEDDGDCHLDMPRLQRLQLEALGVPESSIHETGRCTCCENFFFSYRSDHAITGRQIAFAGFQADYRP